jgi:hypothetical protein
MMRAALIVLNTELGLYCPDLLKQQSVCRHDGEPADTNCIAFGLSE